MLIEAEGAILSFAPRMVSILNGDPSYFRVDIVEEGALRFFLNLLVH
jgi:hypothetical protein